MAHRTKTGVSMPAVFILLSLHDLIYYMIMSQCGNL